MKSFIVLALFVAAALAAPAGPLRSENPEANAEIVRFLIDNIGVGGYSFLSETSNGIQQEETAQLKNVGTENEALGVRGQYSYPGPDGVTYTVIYEADENGFRASGAHLPKSP